MRYFRKDDSNWRIADTIRGMAQFREYNLLADLRPLGRFDIVFCRNVLIYFDQPTKTRVLEAIAGLMPPDGLLYLGGAETVLGITVTLRADAERARRLRGVDGDRDNTRCDATAGGGGIGASAISRSWPGAGFGMDTGVAGLPFRLWLGSDARVLGRSRGWAGQARP